MMYYLEEVAVEVKREIKRMRMKINKTNKIFFSEIKREKKNVTSESVDLLIALNPLMNIISFIPCSQPST